MMPDVVRQMLEQHVKHTVQLDDVTLLAAAGFV